MIIRSPGYDGIRCLLVRHGIGKDLAKNLVPLVTPIPSSTSEGLTNKGHDTHDVRKQHECTGEVKRVWLDFRSIILGFCK